jgi:flagellar motor switch/type III secretory pathway protein FliN
VKKRFQNVPFKCNLHRYMTEKQRESDRAGEAEAAALAAHTEALERGEDSAAAAAAAAAAAEASLAAAAAAALTAPADIPLDLTVRLGMALLYLVGLCRLNQVDPYPIAYNLSNP